MSLQVLTSTYLHGIVDRYADLAQLAERIHGKDEVAGSIPAISINPQLRGWDKGPSLLIVFGLSSKTQWLSGLYYADFISFYSPTQLCGGGTTKSNSNELPISVPLSFVMNSLKSIPKFWGKYF